MPTPTIKELEKLMADEEGSAIEILPNGDVRITKGQKKSSEILTQRQDIGSNY